MIKDLLEKAGGRKFFVAVLVLLLTTLALACHGISGADFRTIVLGVMALYGAANVGQKALDMISAKPKE